MPLYSNLDEVCGNCGMRRGYHYGRASECPNTDLSDAEGSRGNWRTAAVIIYQPKVQPGQVWANNVGNKWHITRVENGAAYAYQIGDTPNDGEEFGRLDQYGCPRSWGSFHIVSSNSALPIRSKPAAPKERSDFEFFRQPSTPGYCVCGIDRKQCNYHR